MSDIPEPREACLLHLLAFVKTGSIEQASTAAGTIVAYLATLEGTDAQLAALDEIQGDLVERVERTEVSESDEERHVAVEDAIEQARRALDASPAQLREAASALARELGAEVDKKPST